MVGPLIVLAVAGAALLAIMKWGVRKGPDGLPITRTSVDTRAAMLFAIPGVLVLLLLLVFARDNGDRAALLALATILSAFALGAIYIRRQL
jgi:uncharacterized integral membrane protein